MDQKPPSHRAGSIQSNLNCRPTMMKVFTGDLPADGLAVRSPASWPIKSRSLPRGAETVLMPPVSPEIKSIRIAGADRAAVQLIRSAALIEFPGAVIRLHADANEACRAAAESDGEILVLAGECREEGRELLARSNPAGYRPWPVIMLGNDDISGGFASVPADVNDERVMALALRFAIQQHALQKENARLKGDLLTMAGRVSHDLKTPLNGIQAAAEALKEILQEKEPASAVLAGSLFRSVEEMVWLMNRVSFMLKASQQTVVPKRVPMGDVIWNVLQRLERQLLSCQLRVIQPEAWPEICGVEDWLDKVWGNLVENVVEHAHQATVCELGWEERGNEYIFWVRDDGCGIAPGRQRDLLRPFHALHSSETGHGLGLSITQRLIDLQGGKLSYEAVAPTGSRFIFTLPKC